MGVHLMIAINILLTLISVLLQMAVLTSLWAWFVTPLGVGPISYAQAFGLNLLVTYFQVRNPKGFKPELFAPRTYRKKMGTQIGIQVTALILGYITTLFM